jgi:hypothetical protein
VYMSYYKHAKASPSPTNYQLQVVTKQVAKVESLPSSCRIQPHEQAGRRIVIEV